MVGVLLALAVAFRCWAVGKARFTGDESHFWEIARSIAKFEAAPAFGPPMTGSEALHPGPIFYYLMAIPQMLGASPWFGGVFVAFLHGLSGWLLFSACKQALGERAGVIGLVLFLFAPWDVLYGDRIWLSCVAPVFGALTVYAAIRASESKRWQGALLFLLLVCPQIHMSAPILWATAAVLLFLRPPSVVGHRALALGFGLTLAAYAWPIFWEVTHAFSNTRAILSKSGGGEAWPELVLAPLRVFGYAVLSGSSEIGYHFARGYWLRFSAWDHYHPSAWLALHGPIWGALNLVSIGLALASWVYAVPIAIQRCKKGDRELSSAVIVALIAGLITAVGLMVISRKQFFPHYTNLLMPMLLFPLVAAIDRALDLRRLRPVVILATFGSVAAMAGSAVRYYRSVDALNGLDATLEMVDLALTEPTPVALYFDSFNNAYAWGVVARVRDGRVFETKADAPVRYRVRNGSPYAAGTPTGTRRFGPLLLERTPPFPEL